MARKGALAVDENALPPFPASDSAPGALDLLLEANRLLRGRRWPPPYDRTRHKMVLGDARELSFIEDESVHLVVTSPPYFNLKPYESDAHGRQLGRATEYADFLNELDRVWRECARVLVPGGRICCVIGDILIPRKVCGRHHVLPLPADIQVRSRDNGLDNLTPILWFKLGNRAVEARRKRQAYYGKPYQPGAIIKSDHEYIIMLRKSGAYRSTPMIKRALSMLQREEMAAWMQPVWTGIPGASRKGFHPAPFPVDIAERLIRLFSFAGDVILDPFAGSGTTAVAAIRSGRHSISVEVEEQYLNAATLRAAKEAADHSLLNHTSTVIEREEPPSKALNTDAKRGPSSDSDLSSTLADFIQQRAR